MKPVIYSLDSSIGQVYQHPAGRDIIDKILLQLGAPTWAVTNPITKNLRIGALKYLSGGKVDDKFLQTLAELLNGAPSEVAVADGGPSKTWWKDAVVYQIYPRSFQDSNDDGIGDLKGITSRLEYLKDLGVGAIWMSPIFDSPNDDMGYDISDYRKVMAEFGTMDDFDDLVDKAHDLGLKVILDLVVNHTSDEHEWYKEALADPSSPYRDYYFFEEGDGTDNPPNNWDSFFSGSAWNHYPEQDVWALHLFSAKQMDLNWDNKAVRDEVADIVRFWVDRGVDGFRLDVINYISKAEGLPDGNALVGDLMGFTGVEHYFYGPHLHRNLAELHAAAFEPGGIFTVGETPGIGYQVGKQITNPEAPELDLLFNFDHLETKGKTRLDDYRYDLNFLKDYYIRAEQEYCGPYWMSLFFENHDNPRMASKVNPDPTHRQALSKLLGGILLTMRGTPFMYQGQEIGMVNQDFKSIDDLRDVEVLNAYAELRQTMSEQAAFAKLLPGTRDHARTPMQWDSSVNGGFSPASPWIPGDNDFLEHNVESESADPDSVLNFYRQLLHWRGDNEDFVYSDVEFIDPQVPDYFAYRRDQFLVQMNLSDRPLELHGNLISLALALGAELVQTNTPGQPSTAKTRALGPYEWRLWRLTSDAGFN